MTNPHIVHMTATECVQMRDKALDKLGMSLEEARAQWADCGCCLKDGNYGDLANLDEVRDMDYLLGEGDYA